MTLYLKKYPFANKNKTAIRKTFSGMGQKD